MSANEAYDHKIGNSYGFAQTVKQSFTVASTPKVHQTIWSESLKKACKNIMKVYLKEGSCIIRRAHPTTTLWLRGNKEFAATGLWGRRANTVRMTDKREAGENWPGGAVKKGLGMLLQVSLSSPHKAVKTLKGFGVCCFWKATGYFSLPPPQAFAQMPPD